MPGQITVTFLVENSVNRRSCLAEHGLAIWIESDSGTILFDTGQSNIITDNARELDISLARTQAVVLSHGHYDHTSGLNAVLMLAPQARIFVHPAAPGAKYSCSSGREARSVSMPARSIITLHNHSKSVVWTSKPTEVLPGFMVTGEIPRRMSYEDPGGSFYLDAQCREPDPILDDQALFFDSAHGLVVLLGCAHAGIVNTLDYVQQLSGGRPVQAVCGGFHLLHASTARMESTLQALRARNIQLLAPAHCTGWPAVNQILTSFPGQCTVGSVGTIFRFEQ